MEIRTENRDVTTDGTLESTTFRIKASAKAFKILIDRLYSDKIKAVCRELMTNAYDAHVVNGNAAQPFEVTLPNTYDHFFAVRDFGCSMTHEQIMGLYSTVFESSKDHSNEAVGQLGLGSKSPFAYSDTFTVTAWLAGEKRVYAAYIGADAMPRIDLMLREPSNDPQGVEVRIPTRRADEHTFIDRVKTLAYGFDVLPLVKGIHNLSLKPKTPVISGNGWRMYPIDSYNRESIQARQGCVLYPLESVGQQSHLVDALLDLPFVVDFPIGQIDFTPSREDISYDDVTKANISARLNCVVAEFLESYKDKLATQKTEADARAFAMSVLNGFGWHQNSLKTKLREFKWRGRRVAAETIDVTVPKSSHGQMLATFHTKEWFLPNRRNRDKLYRRVGAGTISPATTAILYYTPAENLKRITERLHKFASTQDFRGVTNVILLSCDDPASVAVKRFYCACGRPAKVFRLADYVPDRVVRPASQRSQVSVQKVNMWSKLEPVSIDATQGGYYVIRERTTLPKEMSVRDVRDLRDNARALKIIPADAEVYIFPSSIAQRTVKQGAWINFTDLLEKELAGDGLRVIEACEAMGLTEVMRTAPDDVRNLYYYARDNGLIGDFATTGLADAINTYRDIECTINPDAIKARYAKINSMRSDMRMPQAMPGEAKETRKRLWLHKDALDAYPMLKALAKGGILNYATELSILEYVNEIDNKTISVTSSAIAA